MLIQIQYTISGFPSTSNMVMGTWCFNVSSLKTLVVLDGLRQFWAAPLIASQKIEPTAFDAHKLKVIRQARSVILALDKPTLVTGMMQHVEELEFGNLNIVHGIRLVRIS